MKNSFITYSLTFISLTCYANSSPQEGEMSSIPKILFGVLLIIFIAVICIFIDNRIRNNKQSEKTRDREDEKKPNDIDKNKINENIDLKKVKNELEAEIEKKDKEIEKKDKEIEKLNKQLSEKSKEIASLRSQINEMNISSSRSSTHSKDSNENDSNKQEDKNNKKTDLGDNNKTNSNPLVGKMNFIELAVINGSLVKEESEQTYYRAWRENGQIMFEFVNNDRTRKAINNRTIIIEPFCIKQESSKSPDVSKEIETKTPGILNDDYTLRKKAEIIYK